MNLLSNFDYFAEVMLSVEASSTSARNVWMDNFSLYQVHSIDALDVNAMQSALTSEKDIIEADNTISGYGTVTVNELIALFTPKTVGTTPTIRVINEDGEAASGAQTW